MSYISKDPGHLGNLSEPQIALLKEMWTYLLCGLDYDLIDLDQEYQVEAAATKKGGLFGKKKVQADVRNPREIVARVHSAMEIDGKRASPEKILQTLQGMMRSDHPDTLMLRFLRARKWDLVKALEMLGHTFKWRINEGHVDEILFDGDGGAKEKGNDEVLHQWRTGKCYTMGVDKMGRPLVFVHVKLHWPKDQSEENIKNFTIQIIEGVRLCLNPPVETAAVVFDLTDFSLSNMDYPAVKFIIQCFQAHYPECLGFLLIHNAPWVFSGVWNIIKGLIDPVVASKISFTRSTSDMEKFIDPEHIPTHLGGKRAQEYDYIEPYEGENELLKDSASRKRYQDERVSRLNDFIEETAAWIKANPGKDSDIAQAAKNRAAENLSESYWNLDPYVRAKSIYDRNGTYEYFKPDRLPKIRPPADTPVITQGMEKIAISDNAAKSNGQTITA